MDLIYNLTREQAAAIMEISTRTLDRHIRKWLLSYKKIWNKVMLSEQEINDFIENAKNSPWLNYSEIVWNTHIINPKEQYDENEITNMITDTINSNFDNFMKLVKEKDNQLEEKNNFIYVLQHRIWELENKLKNMIALPDYTNEKNDLMINNEKILVEKNVLLNELKKEKLKNLVYTIVLILIVLIFVFAVINFYK